MAIIYQLSIKLGQKWHGFVVKFTFFAYKSSVLMTVVADVQKQFTYFAICCIITSNLIVLQGPCKMFDKIQPLITFASRPMGHYGNKTHSTTK